MWCEYILSHPIPPVWDKFTLRVGEAHFTYLIYRQGLVVCSVEAGHARYVLDLVQKPRSTRLNDGHDVLAQRQLNSRDHASFPRTHASPWNEK